MNTPNLYYFLLVQNFLISAVHEVNAQFNERLATKGESHTHTHTQKLQSFFFFKPLLIY